MIKSAIEHMRAIQMQSLAVEVGYTPLSGEARTIRAVVGRTVFRSTDVDGVWTRIETRTSSCRRSYSPLSRRSATRSGSLGAHMKSSRPPANRAGGGATLSTRRTGFTPSTQEDSNGS